MFTYENPGWCEDLAAALGQELRCCESCHQDYDEGYDWHSDVEYDGQWYLSCCSGIKALPDD